MTYRFFFVSLLLTALPAWADINTRTNIADLFSPYSGQAMGAVTLSVDGDDFRGVSPQNPVYISLQLDQGVTLCETLVGPDGPGPIYIPMRLEGGLLTDSIAADVKTASIVRWVAGEDQIWLKIQSDSGTWIESAFGPIPPDPTRPVSFNFGVSARVSDEANIAAAESADNFNANLPYHTRDPLAQTDPALSVSTLFCTDLTNSSLEAAPAPSDLSLANFDPVSRLGSRGVETADRLDNIQPGTPWSVGFHNDTKIGRAYPVPDCQIGVEPAQEPADQGVGFLSYTVTSDCGFHVDSYLELELLNPTTGFQLWLDTDGNPIQSNGEYLLLPKAFRVLDNDWSAATAKPEDVLLANGVWIARKARTRYNGAGTESGTWIYNFEVALAGVISPPLIQVRATPGVATRPSRYIDEPEPYTGPEQMDFCSGRVYTQTITLNIKL